MPTRTYQCLTLQQRTAGSAPALAVFHAAAGELLEWCAIRRLGEEVAAPQRPESKSKINALARFLKGDDRNVIPTAVVISLRLGGVAELGPAQQASQPAQPAQPAQPSHGGLCQVLTITTPDGATGLAEAAKPGFIVDGQHRVLGARQFDPKLNLVVVALVNASLEECAFQFLVINNKASRVSSDHVRALVGELEQAADEDLEHRLETARLSLRGNFSLVIQVDREEESPFRNNVDWPANRVGPRLVVPAAIEASLSYIHSRNVRALSESEDNLLGFFYTIWGTVKAKWPELWTADTHLLTKVGVICFNQYLCDALITLADWGQLDLRDPDLLMHRTGELLKYQSKEFWRTAWTSASLDTKSGRELVVESLKQISRNMRAEEPWYSDVPLIDVSRLGQEAPREVPVD